MLRNELKGLQDVLFVDEGFDNDIIAGIDLAFDCSRIQIAWEEAMFSDISENSLMRYFYYHLECISSILDFLTHRANRNNLYLRNELLALIDRISKFYPGYLNLDAIVPTLYQQRFFLKLREHVESACYKIKLARLNTQLRSLLLKWLKEMLDEAKPSKYTFRSLHYFEHVVLKICSLDPKSENIDNLIISLLIQVNFNHLSFFVFRQNSILKSCDTFNDTQEKLNYLKKRKIEVLSCPEANNMAYDSTWPSIKNMLGQWLQEEILLLEQISFKESAVNPMKCVEKLSLEMSVSHMACLIRLLYEESVFASQNLQFIFKCFAGYFQSKRQSVISPGSLSKEFYSIDQHTAARVRDLLQRMVLRINRNFFPMGVVANVTILSYLSMR